MPRKHTPEHDEMIDVLVTVEDRYRDTLPEVSRRLQAAGLTVDDLFELSGVIAGKAMRDDLAKLNGVEGVAAVEQEPTFRTT